MNKSVGLKCIVKGCENHKNEGGFEDEMCLPCYLFITTGEGIYSQAYRNTHPVKELTDEEIEKEALKDKYWDYEDFNFMKFAKAILKKAQEK